MNTFNYTSSSYNNPEKGFTIIEAAIGLFLITVLALGAMEAAKQSSSQVQNIEMIGSRDRILQKLQNSLNSSSFYRYSTQSPTGFAPSGTNDDFKKCLTGEITSWPVIINGCTANTVFPISLYDASGNIIADGTNGTFYNSSAVTCAAQSAACPIKAEANFKATCKNATATCTQADNIEVTFKISAPTLPSVSSVFGLNTGDTSYVGSITGGLCPPKRVMRGVRTNGLPDCWSWMGHIQGQVVGGIMLNIDAHTTTVDRQGNFYAAGTASASSSYGGIANAGGNDVFLQKYNSQGALAWETQFGSTANDAGPTNPSQIAIDTSGNIYIAGGTAGSLPGNTNAGSVDVFIAKFDASGTRLWIRQFGSANNETISNITFDSANNLIVAGVTQGNLFGAGNNQDVFLAKFDPSGSLVWGRQFGSTANEFATKTYVDSGNNIYLVGSTTGTLPGNTASGTGGDAFVARFNSSGTPTLLSQFSTTLPDGPNDIKVNSTGDIYVSGVSGSSADHNFLAKLNSSGSLQWYQQYPVGALILYNTPMLALDNSGNIFIAGTTAGSFAGFTNAGATDVYLIKYNAAGTLRWVQQFGSPGSDAVFTLLSDAAGNIYLSGITTPTLPGNTAIGSGDFYIAKFNNSGTQVFLKQYGTVNDDIVDFAILDPSETYLFVSGSTAGTIDLKYNVSTMPNDPFMMKFEAATGR